MNWIEKWTQNINAMQLELSSGAANIQSKNKKGQLIFWGFMATVLVISYLFDSEVGIKFSLIFMFMKIVLYIVDGVVFLYRKLFKGEKE